MDEQRDTNQSSHAYKRAQIWLLLVASIFVFVLLIYRWQSGEIASFEEPAVLELKPQLRVELKSKDTRHGIFELPTGSTVRDLIRKAHPEGISESSYPNSWADMPLFDGASVMVWTTPEGVAQLAINKMDSQLLGVLLIPLNLNDATEAELADLPNIGPTTAAKVVAYRVAYGPFQRLEDLKQVEGIGDKTVESLRYQVVVGSSDREVLPALPLETNP